MDECTENPKESGPLITYLSTVLMSKCLFDTSSSRRLLLPVYSDTTQSLFAQCCDFLFIRRLNCILAPSHSHCNACTEGLTMAVKQSRV